MQSKHKYILIFGGISVCYLLIMIAVGHFEPSAADTSGSVEEQVVRVENEAEEKEPGNLSQAADRAAVQETAGPEEKFAVDRTPETTKKPVPEITEVPAADTGGKQAAVQEGEASAEPVKEPKAAKTAKQTPKPTENPVFYGYKNVSDERKEVVNLAKSYIGKIGYYWGGKPSNGEIKGKEEPNKLDCSGFIQFIYSQAVGKRIESLGATISIHQLEKIGKKSLKPGDIGLKRGTGSLYFDADGKSYPEPALAELSNERHVNAAKNRVEDLEDRIEDINDTIEEKVDKIEAWKDGKKRVYGKAKKIGVVHRSADGDTFTLEEAEDEHAEKLLKLYQKKFTFYHKLIEKCRVSIENLREKRKSSKEQIKVQKKIIKKYDREIKRQIDHVGIYCGKDKKGREIWCHCSSSGHGVVWEHTDIFKYYYRYFKD